MESGTGSVGETRPLSQLYVLRSQDATPLLGLLSGPLADSSRGWDWGVPRPLDACPIAMPNECKTKQNTKQGYALAK